MQALHGISFHTAELELIMTVDEGALTSGRMDASVLSLPMLPIPGPHVQGGSVQQLFINFGSMSGKTGCTITRDKLTLKTLKPDFL